MVNRIWQYHFGRGIVATPNDFGGRMGERPTHLSCWIISPTNSWRAATGVKHIHRLILSSNTYRQSSAVPEKKSAGLEKDPDNKLLCALQSPAVSMRKRFVTPCLRLAGNLNPAAGGPKSDGAY